MREKFLILVVDDEPEVLELVSSRVGSHGYDIVTASRGLDAVDIARKELPDLILLDIVLPDVDGPQVARCLLEDQLTRSIPVLFLSGIVANSQDSKSLSEVKVNDHVFHALGKPFSLEQLLIHIKKILPDQN